MADQVEAAIEELYSLSPSEFTKRRDELVKELKKVGDKDGAARIAARKKPTQMAWVLNQLARSEPDAVADLVDVGRELVREQRRALRGEASHGLRESIDRQRKAIAEAGKKATEVMRGLGVDPMAHLQEITMALQAALVDPAVGAALEAGRLEKAPEAAVGFGGAMAPAAPESEPAPKAKKSDAPPAPKKSEPPPRDELADRRKKKATDDAERKREAAEREKEAERKREAAEREKAAERKRMHAAHAKSVAEATAVLRAAEKEVEAARDAAEAAATEAEAATLVAKKAHEAAATATANAKALAAEIPRAERTVAAAQKELTRLEANAPD